MKRTMNVLMATSMLFAQNAWSNEGLAERIRGFVGEKLRQTEINASAGLNLNLDIADALRLGTGLDYEYSLDPDSGKYLRQDRWEDKVRARLGYGVVADREIKRILTYGRYYADWSTALTNFMFSPLNLRGLNSAVLQNSMRAGDMAAVTLEKASFLGLDVTDNSGTIGLGGKAGKVFSGKITVKILKRADGKVTLNFANADENSIVLAGRVNINIIPGLLRLKLLQVEQNLRLRGKADLATFTYDLNNPVAAAALDQILQSFDEVSILQDDRFLRDGIDLSPEISKGLINVVASDEASESAGSGVVKEQDVNNDIVLGSRSRVRFRFLSNHSTDSAQSMNIVDLNISGNGISTGQYLVGYRSESQRTSGLGNRSQIKTTSSVVYKPDPVLTDSSQARGYRGLSDLIGISYHTEARGHQNVKELLTYAKLCNAGILNCGGDIAVSVVPEGSAAADRLERRSNIYSNYFISRGLFEQIRNRLQWSRLAEDQKRAAILENIEPLVSQFVVEGAVEKSREVTNFLYDVLEHGCYSNLIGLEARNVRGFFRRMFNTQCAKNIYELSDENIRFNLPSLLISLYKPTLFGNAQNPYVKASAADKAELAQHFAVSVNTTYQTSDEMERNVNGLDFGLSRSDSGGSTGAEAIEFTSLIETWQQQTHNSLTYSDRQRMLRNLN